MANTKISWTDKSWNPISGCSKVSDGCKNCYAEVMAKRLQAMGIKGYENGFEVTEHWERLTEPYYWKKPNKIFVCSMGDLFHESVSDSMIVEVFKVMRNNPLHTFQLLTKRTGFILIDSPEQVWTDNIWLGVTIENEKNVLRL
ncbi:DUF5131 family protein, partial [Bacteroidetes/Chlorobi group bacterium ChocPot_Mid]